MKRLLLLGLLLGGVPAQAGKPPAVRCPGETTVEMRDCASQALEQSQAQVRRKLSEPLFKQWQAATQAVCTKAYAAYKDGTIYPQLVVGCADNLNRSLIKEFTPLDR